MDSGAGQISTVAGFLVFLTFLLLATHLLVGLYATTTVTAAAQDGARLVASSNVDHQDPESVRAARMAAEDRVRSLLGSMGEKAVLDWRGSTVNAVVLRVTVPWPGLFPSASSHLRDLEVDRTVIVRTERVR